MIAAIIRVRTPSGAPRSFLADSVDIAEGLVHAVGIWRDGPPGRRERSWPTTSVVEIRWTRERVAA